MPDRLCGGRLLLALPPGAYVELREYPDFIRECAKYLDGSDVRVVEIDSRFFLTGPLLEQIPFEELGTTASEIITDLQSCFFASFNHVPDISVTGVIQVYEDGRIRFANYFQTRRLLTHSDLGKDGKFEEARTFGRSLFRLLRTDPKVRSVYEWLRAGTYADFFKIYETIEEDVGGSLVKTKYLTKRENDLLGANLHEPSVSGKLARHATVKRKLSSERRMDPRDVESLIKRIVEQWVRTKFNE